MPAGLPGAIRDMSRDLREIFDGLAQPAGSQ